jgi:hypothetical protein
MIGCVSGSPKRQLNSNTLGFPSRSIITPAYKKPAIRSAVGSHALDRGYDHFAHDLRMYGWCNDGRRRIRAHAAGVGAQVPIAETLVILRRRERQHVATVDHDDEARLLAFEKSSITTRALRRAQRVGDQHLHRSLHCASSADAATTTPLPAASPSALTTIGDRASIDVRVRRRRFGECLISRRRNPMARHERLREVLRAFELRSRARRAENS